MVHGPFCVFIHPVMLLFKKLAWLKVRDAWLIRFMVHDSWVMVMAHAARFMVHGSWYMEMVHHA
jgi:hypothetical protein